MAFFAVGTMLSGVLIGKTRLLQPYELIGGLLATAGAALLYTLDTDSSKARYLGSQILFGFGIGLGSQVPMTAAQSFSKPEDVAPTTGIMLSKYPEPIQFVQIFTNLATSVQRRERRLLRHCSAIHFRQPSASDTCQHCA
jgi:hypothetical protein